MGRHKGLTEADYRKHARLGATMAETARALGVTPQTVFGAAARYKIEFERGQAGRKPKAQQEGGDAGKAE